MRNRVFSFVMAVLLLFMSVDITALAEQKETLPSSEDAMAKESAEEPENEPMEAQAAEENANVYLNLLTRSGSTDSVTRIEWLEALVNTFQMTVEEENYPDNYYSDIDASSECYRTAMLATEFGLVDVKAGGALCPYEAATREFAVHTLNQCLGFQTESSDYTFNEAGSVTYPDDIQSAIEQNWFTLSDGNFYPNEVLTQADKVSLVNYAGEIISSTKIDPGYRNQYEFSDNVLVLSDITAEMTDENEYTLYGCDTPLKNGDIFAFTMDEMPIVKRAVSITSQGDALVVLTESIAVAEAFTNIDIQGNTEADLSKVQAYNEDIELRYIVGGSADENFEDGEKFSSISETGGREISAVELVKFYDIPEQIKEKYDISDGVTAEISCKISNVKADYKIKSSSAYLNMDATAAFSCNVSIDVLKELGEESSIALARVPVGGIGYMKMTLDLSSQGNLTLSYAEHISMGVQYDINTGFRLVTDFYKEYFTITAYAEAAAGFTASVGVDCAGVIRGEIYAKAGAKATVDSQIYTDGNMPLQCTHVSAWLYTSVGCQVKADLLIATYTTYNRENEISVFNEKNSPVRVAFHFEDGVPVSRCTRENPEGGSENPDSSSRWKYYTQVNSKYAYNAASSVTGADGNSNAVFEYSLDSDNHATITKYSGNDSTLRIPDTLDGYQVVGIGNSVFQENTSLRMVVIPDSVTEIGELAFCKCSNLSEVILSKSLVSMNSGAFMDCISLTAIEIPKSLNKTFSTNGGVFQGCDNLKNVTFEEGTTQIADDLFYNCGGIEKIEIPDTVSVIESSAFESCANLKELTIPASVAEIEDNAFCGCSSLTAVVFPDNVAKIGEMAFYKCSNLSEVTLSKHLASMGGGAFRDCTSLTAIEIPKSLDRTFSFSGGVFEGCDNLKNVTFEEGTTQIAADLFYNCGAIEKIEIPDTVTVIERSAFQYCTNLKGLTIPVSVTEIQESAFYGCVGLTAMVIPDSVTKIEGWVFGACKNLKEVQLPSGITALNEYLFADCTALTTIKLPEKVEVIEAYSFNNAGLTEIVLPDALTEIGNYAFENCSALTQVTMGEKLTKIGKDAFYNCDALTAVSLPDSVTILGTNVFGNCEKLSDVKLSSGITDIPSYAFWACPSLKEIIIPYKVKEIKTNSFTYCTALEKVAIPRATTVIADSVFSYPDKMTIYGVSGTYAETYANSKNITFVSQEIPIKKLAFNQAELKMVVGTSQSLILNTTPSYFTDGITWQSSDTAVATVSDGIVTAIGLGTAKISALAGDTGAVKAVCKVTVVQPVTGISLNSTSVTLDGGDTFLLQATVMPDDACNKEIQFSSSDESVASVSETGLITALKRGKSTIKAMAQDGSGQYATCKVTVTCTTIIVNEVSELKCIHPYENDCNKLWIYRLEGADYLNVTFNEQTKTDYLFDFIYVLDGTNAKIGKYTGKQLSGKTVTVPGDTVKIRLVSDPTITAYGFEVESVSKVVTLKSISLDKTFVHLKQGNTEKLEVIYNPEDTTEAKDVVFTSSDEGVAKVSSDGTITAVSEGTAIITAKVSGKEASCEVSVFEGAEKIIMNPEEIVLHKGETGKAAYTIVPANAVTEDIRWENSNKDVVEMKEMKGLSYVSVKGIAAGDSVISVNIDGMTATCNVTVKDKITLDYQDGTGKTEEIDAEYGKTLSILSEITPKRDGYIFAGWYTQKDGQGRHLTEKTVITDEWTLYAYWEKVKEGFSVLPVGDQLYTGKALKPAVVVYDGETLLQEKKDYTVSYKNNTNVTADLNKMPLITVKGKGNYTGTDTVTFRILPRDIAGVSFAADDLVRKYNSKVQKPTPVLTWNGKKLKNKRDYTVTFVDETDGSENAYKAPGSYTIKLEGRGNFTGTRTVSLEITEENLISKAKIGKIAKQKYNGGNEITPGFTVKMGATYLTEGVDYEVAYENNREVGKATAIVTGTGSYAGSKRITFSIVGESLKKAKTEGIVNAYYTGEEITQNSRLYVINKDKSRTYLTEGEDYEVSYQNNLLPGRATVLFTGMNAYKGTSLRTTFKISAYPIATDPDEAMEVLVENEVPYTKGGARPVVTVRFGGELLEEGADYKLSYKNNTAVAGPGSKKVPVVTIKGKGRFTGTIPAKSYTIVKQDLSKLSITANDKVVSKKGNAYKTSITIIDLNGKKLAAGKDYDKNFIYTYHDNTTLLNDVVKNSGDMVEGSDIIPVGTVIDVTVKSKGDNYTGQIKGSYRIVPMNIKSAKISVPAQIYSGREIKLNKEDIKITIKGYTLKPEEFEIVEGSYVNNIKKGTAKVTIKAVGKDYGGSRTVSFKIKSKRIFW